MRNKFIACSLLLAACGLPTPSDPKPAGNTGPQAVAPCANNTAAVGALDGRAVVCAGFSSCNSPGWSLCQGISPEAQQACDGRQGVYLGAEGKRSSGGNVEFGCQPGAPAPQPQNTTYWRACGKAPQGSAANYYYKLTWPCGGFLYSLDCAYLDAAHCAALPSSAGAFSVCCPT